MPRAPLFLIGALAVTLALPPLTASAAIVTEVNCGDCVDDDGDDLVDRKDPDCNTAPPANGGNIGVGDVTRGKAVAKCAKTIQKAGTKFVLGTMKQIQKCTQASATCIQLKPGDPACQAKAVATCGNIQGAIRTAINKLEDTIIACDPEEVVYPDLVSLQGLGFSAENCNNGTTGLIAGNCIADQHLCRAQQLVGIGTPRARELIAFGGQDPDGDLFSCINNVAQADGGNSGVDPTHAKALLKCGKTIDKLSLSLLGAGAKTVQGCLDAGIACLQVKPTDPNCLTKARAKCDKTFDKLQDPFKGTVAKLAGKLQKACSVSASLSIVDLSSTSGLGLSVQIPRCTALGASGIDRCFGAQAFCEGGYVIERQIPRARELADLLGVEIIGFDF